MRFRKKTIEKKDIEEPDDIKELLFLAKKIEVPQFSESFWKMQYNKIYEQWESKKASYRVKKLFARVIPLILFAVFSVYFIRFFIFNQTGNKNISYESISVLSQETEIPDSHTFGIENTEDRVFPIRDFVDFFNYAPANMQNAIINDVLQSK
ncbi:MAG: hypothetical protein M1135_00270 [Candidatus Omnitrophica bacterium]|jgi:hypothetical protein|nr:hypothetical protein [Candidatus Omnitrophota bacterium]